MNEEDEQRKSKLETKCTEARQAAALLAGNSAGVRSLIHTRISASNIQEPKIIPVTTRPLSKGSLSTSVSSATKVARNEGRLTSKKSVITSIPSDTKKKLSTATSSTKKSKRQHEVETPVREKSKRIRDSPDEKIIIKKSRRDSTLSTPSDNNKSTTKPKPYLNRRIAKDFDGDVYFGHVKSYVPSTDNDEGVDLWSIVYDDGDAEDFEEDELMIGFLLYRKNSINDKVGNLQKSNNKKIKSKNKYKDDEDD